MRNEKLYNLYFLSDIVRVIKSSRMTHCERVIYRGAWVKERINMYYIG
jgi:hypothetical protein